MKNYILLFALFSLTISCKKDSNTNDNPNPITGSCKLTSFQELTSSGNVNRIVRYDDKKRIIRWGVDSIVYNDFTNEFTVISSNSGRWLGSTPKGKINANNLITDLSWSAFTAKITYDSEGRLSSFLLTEEKGLGGGTTIDLYGNAYKSDFYPATDLYSLVYQGNEVKEINRTQTDSVKIGVITGPNFYQRDLNKWDTWTTKITYNYDNQTVFSVNPLNNFFGWIFGKRSSVRIPTSRTAPPINDTTAYEFGYEFEVGTVMQVNGNTPKIISNQQYLFEGCN